jgi:enamine deaminase RidA (YjgF/YER057c/UK114 family)
MHPREFNVAVHRFLNPSAIPAPRGYSHVVETKGPSRTIYLAGQLGMTADGKFAGGPGDFRAQATQCFENIKAGLAAVGATFEHVVKLNNYLVDMVHLPVYFEACPRRRALRSRGDRGGAGIKARAVTTLRGRIAFPAAR